MHTFFENITKDLYKPTRTEHISAAIFLLFDFEYRIFHFHQTKYKNNNYKTTKNS